MPLSLKPTPAPEIPIEGAEMIIPLVCIGIFFLIVLGLLAWFFIVMNRGDERSQARQEKMYRSPALRRMAKYMSARSFFPESYGASGWKSWLHK